jgi:hypothetical protein
MRDERWHAGMLQDIARDTARHTKLPAKIE